MDQRPPLHLHLLAHPKSDEANRLAEALMRRFVEPPASGGLRVPVFFTPDRGDDLPPRLDPAAGLDLDAALHTIVVVLGDERMVRRVGDGTGEAWIGFVKNAFERAPLDSSPHHVLPVALEARGFELSEERHVLHGMLSSGMKPEEAEERRLAEISFHIAARALQLLENGKIPASAPGRIEAPVTIFLSHAKADLDQTHHEDAVRQTRQLLDELPVAAWYDVQQIAPSQKFAEAISAAIRDCSILLAFQTDHYSSRPWCRREVLTAKRHGAHVLVVDALRTGEPRSFPYGGNVPTVRWRFRESSRVDAQRVIDRAVLEALRFKHNRAVLEGAAEPGEVVVPAAPEALTLAHHCADAAAEATFLYPDPPLGREELEVLQRLRPKARFLTPLTKLARRRPANVESVTVSISGGGDARKHGLSEEIFDTLSDEIHLYLLLAGLRILYGGALKGAFSGASNFTLRLLELARTYSKLAEGVESKPVKNAILNVAPWPLRLSYGEAEWKLFESEVVGYEEGPRPELPFSDEELFPSAAAGTFPAADTPLRRYAWARGLSAMREHATASSQARLVIGGRSNGFLGLVPGVVEEAWLSLKHGKPLYLAGGLGGAGRAVTDQLLGMARPEFTEASAAESVPDYQAGVDLYGRHGGEFHSLEVMGADIASLGQAGLAEALNNGLDEAQNRELLACTDAQRIAELVLTGLRNL